MTQSLNRNNLETLALEEMRGRESGMHAVARLLPLLIKESNTAFINLLFDTFGAYRECRPQDKPFPYLAELMALLAVPDADNHALAKWTGALIGDDEIAASLGDNIRDLADALGKTGLLGFSFPLWRFLAKRARRENGTEISPLLEQAGMTRIFRDTDTRIGKDGTREDWLGTGYLAVKNEMEIEYRRSYLRITSPKYGTLLIRNSSYFWGRDRLPQPAYFGPHAFSRQEILAFDPAKDATALLFPIIFRVLWGRKGENIRKLFALLRTLRAFETELARWLCDTRGCSVMSSSPLLRMARISPGFAPLLGYLSAQIDSGAGPLPILGFIDPHLPPWFPCATLKIDKNTLREISRLTNQTSRIKKNIDTEALDFFRKGIARRAKLVLLSGKNGDIPID